MQSTNPIRIRAFRNALPDVPWVFVFREPVQVIYFLGTLARVIHLLSCRSLNAVAECFSATPSRAGDDEPSQEFRKERSLLTIPAPP